MNKYNCLIIDDETLAQDLIQDHLSKVPNFQIIERCHTAMEAMQVLNEHDIDLMFLDIEMPDLTGLELLRSLKNPPYTILTTAYAEYALESYELNVIDYLLKPILFERFFKAVNKVLKLLRENEISSEQSIQQEENNGKYIFVKSEYKAFKVRFDEIVYIESIQKYVRFHLKKKKIMSIMSLSSLTEILPKDQFVRCQKSFIVNFEEIEGIDGNQLIMSSGVKIPVSKSIKAELIGKIDRNNLLG